MKLKRLLLALLLLGAAVRAEAVDYTGLWFNPVLKQDGYGFNLAQSDDYIFVTFYVFGPNNTPTWYIAGLNWDGVDRYSGDVYFVTSGTFFGIPWNKDRDFSGGKAGTASFRPSTTNNYQGTLAYTVTGVGSANVAIERQTLTSIATGGSYAGAQSGAYGCTNPNDDYGYVDTFNLALTHLANGSATFEFSYPSLSCTLAGNYELHGQYYLIANATYACSDGLSTTASMSDVKATALGIEGRFFVPNVGGGCAESATFSGVFLQ